MSATRTVHRRDRADNHPLRPLALAIGAGAIVLVPGFFLGTYTSGLLVQAFLFGMVALLTDVIWGYAGILTFCSAAMFGIGAYAIGIGFVHYASTPGIALLAIAAAATIAGGLSYILGWLAFYSRTRVSEFYVAVVTLGVSLLFGQAVLYGGAITGGSNGLSGFATFGLSNRSWYFLAGLALISAIGASLRIVNSDFGLVLRAIRDNELRCRYLGIGTPGIRTAVFAASNAAIATVGAFYALYTTVVAPSLVSMSFATNVLIWVIIGGRATIIGPAIAAILITAATPQLSTSIPLYWQGLLGLTFVLVVMYLPRGVLPEFWQGLGRMIPGGFVRLPVPARTGGDTSFEISEARAGPSGRDNVLEISGVSKNFGSFHAVEDVTFTVGRGELLSIVGPNGAGKTSLVKCICDGNERTSGDIIVDGTPIERSPPDAVAALGVGRKFQAASVFDTLTVGECIRIATWKGRTPSVWNRSRTMRLAPGAAEVVNSLGLKAVWDVAARDISHGQRQALELAMVLALEPSVIILDEPTAGLSTHERSVVGEVLQRLVATGRLAIILIEHDFEFVKRISTRIVVLVGGRLLADGTVAEVSDSEIVRDAYLGRTHKRDAK